MLARRAIVGAVVLTAMLGSVGSPSAAEMNVVSSSSNEGDARPSRVMRSSLTFWSARDNGSYVVNGNGSGLRQVTKEGIARISPNGKWIAFVRVTTRSSLGFDERSELKLIETKSGHQRRLAEGKYLGRLAAFAWAPDSKRLAYFGDSGGTSALFVVPIRGGRPKRVALRTGELSATFTSAPRWSPDGRWILFGYHGLQIVHPDGRGLRTLASGPVTASSWAPDSRRVVYGLGYGVAEGVYIRDLRRHVDRVVRREGIAFELEWAPRGERILIDFGNPWVVKADGSGLTRLIDLQGSGFGFSYNFTWSPNGQAIAFSSSRGPRSNAGSVGDIYVLDIASREVHSATQGFHYGYSNGVYEWTPRSRSAERIRGWATSWAIPTDSLEQQRVLRTTAPIAQLSADGSRVAIAYRTSELKCLEIWNPVVHQLTRISRGPCGSYGSPPPSPFSDLALAGTRAGFAWFNPCGMRSNCYMLTTASLEQPAPVYAGGLCPSWAPFNCDRLPIGDVRGDGSLLAFDSWTGLEALCRREPCATDKRDGQLWTIRNGSDTATLITTAPGELTVLSVDDERILVREGDAIVSVFSSSGTRTRSVTVPGLRSAQFQGPDLTVLTTNGLQHYNAANGDLRKVWNIGDAAAAELLDVHAGIALYLVGTTVHLLRLSDGRHRAIAAAGTGPVKAQLDDAGLFYSFGVDDGPYKGRVVFVPNAELFSDL